MPCDTPGSGPYGRIRELRTRVQDCKYELGLIAEGMRRPIGKKRLNEILAESRQEIRTILAEEKAKKADSI